MDASVITNEPRKRTLSSYIRNQDNISGDRDQYIKRIKQTVNPGMFPNRIYSLPYTFSMKRLGLENLQAYKRYQSVSEC